MSWRMKALKTVTSSVTVHKLFIYPSYRIIFSCWWASVALVFAQSLPLSVFGLVSQCTRREEGLFFTSISYFLPPQPKDQELTVSAPFTTSYQTFAIWSSYCIYMRPFVVRKVCGSSSGFPFWMTSTDYHHLLVGRVITSHTGAEHFGPNTDDVRWFKNRPLSLPVLWCKFGVSGP